MRELTARMHFVSGIADGGEAAGLLTKLIAVAAFGGFKCRSLGFSKERQSRVQELRASGLGVGSLPFGDGNGLAICPQVHHVLRGGLGPSEILRTWTPKLTNVM